MRSSDSAPLILIADDQADVLEALRLLLKGEGYQIESATSPAGIISALEARDFDVVLMDLNYTRDTTSGQEGLDLLSRSQTIDSILPEIVASLRSGYGVPPYVDLPALLELLSAALTLLALRGATGGGSHSRPVEKNAQRFDPNTPEGWRRVEKTVGMLARALLES